MNFTKKTQNFFVHLITCAVKPNFSRKNDETLKKRARKVKIMSEISFASVERKVPSRKDTLTEARRYFKFTVFSIGKNIYELSDLADEIVDGIFYARISSS